MSVSAGTGGTCVLTTTGTRTQTGGVYLSQLSPLINNATYVVNGQANYTYAISLPITITLTETAGGTETMTNNSLIAESTSEGIGLIGSLNSSGEDKFTFGGTLAIVAAQLAGVYIGTFNVAINYY